MESMKNPENSSNTEMSLSESEVDTCITVLNSLLENTSMLGFLPDEKRNALLSAAGRLSKPDHREILKRKNELKKARRDLARQRERNARAETGIRKARITPVFFAPKQISSNEMEQNNKVDSQSDKTLILNSPRNCYVCKAEFSQMHFFYDSMCPACAKINYEKRFQTAPLLGQTAIITGARLKIGYHAALMMLRSGATVIVTTRFPIDAAQRYSKEGDFSVWKNRLHVFGLDLRHTPSVEIFATFFENNFDRLDILINNAAQTVRRPPGFYSHLMDAETTSENKLSPEISSLLDMYLKCKKDLVSFNQNNFQGSLSNEKALPVSWQGQTPGMGIIGSAELSQIPYTHDQSLVNEKIFPAGKLDADLQQIDLRSTNSWRLKLGEIPTSEMVEIQLVNAIAPFVLCNRLVTVMRRDYTGQKHIVNVTAMEGKFYRFKKADRHPHTNMAKAALNMLTHTSASDFAKDGIFMNAVDTGWVTDEDPVNLSNEKQEKHDFQPPLDIVDGAARVCDPFFHGINTGHHVYGKFLKDYMPIDW
jgi:NAD(P)-dependent dehydrogenase (short-subunit alcohol dehydrogenase family)